MKRIPFAALAALILLSCGGKVTDPVGEAIKAEITGNMSEGFTTVNFLTYEKIDSTTFREEFARRKTAFEAKKASDEKFLVKYTTEGKKKNAALKNESLKEDFRILAALDSLEAASAAILDEVAYYDYVFSADAKGPGSKMQFRDAYAAITPDGKVIGMTAKKSDLHKGLGKVIPGYLRIVKGLDDEESGSGEVPVEE